MFFNVSGSVLAKTVVLVVVSAVTKTLNHICEILYVLLKIISILYHVRHEILCTEGKRSINFCDIS